MRWNDNITYIFNKASSRLRYIRRTTLPTLPQLGAKAYATLVRPNLEYAATVWDGSLTQTQAVKEELPEQSVTSNELTIKSVLHSSSISCMTNPWHQEKLQAIGAIQSYELQRSCYWHDRIHQASSPLSEHAETQSALLDTSLQHWSPQKNFIRSPAKLWNNLVSDCMLLVGPPVAG